MRRKKSDQLFYEERARLGSMLDEKIRFALAEAGIPPVNDVLNEVYGEYALGRNPDQREMRFFLDDVAAFTPELLNRIRRLVQYDFPSWAVVPQFEECEIRITLFGIDFSPGRVQGPVTAETPPYRQWLQSAHDCDAEKYGPIRRQLRWIAPQVPKALDQLATERVVVIGVFDRYPRPHTGQPIWVLLRPADRDAYPNPPIGPAAQYPVECNGQIHPRYSKRFNILSGEVPAAWLTTFVMSIPPSAELELTGADRSPIAPVRLPETISDDILKSENQQ